MWEFLPEGSARGWTFGPREAIVFSRPPLWEASGIGGFGHLRDYDMPLKDPEVRREYNAEAYRKRRLDPEFVKKDRKKSKEYAQRKRAECPKFRDISNQRTIKSQKKRRAENPQRYWINRALKGAKVRAKKKSIPFSLSLKDIKTPDICPIFGFTLNYNNVSPRPNSPSLDRIDSSKGYTKDNVWTISWRANNIKKDATIEELEMLVRALRETI